ncbi:MAG: hypothetical protein NC218_08415 [Acetobacter sp.]|nr:hypothetical protein [Acetobacter sp.]
MSYTTAQSYTDDNEDIKISILLGTVTGQTRLLCLDLDDCFEADGCIETQTREFLKEFDECEYEVSSSGEGIHVYILTNMDLETFIVKDLEGCKSFECYTNKRHIVTTTFDFENTNLIVGKHDDFLKKLYDRVLDQKTRQNNQVEAIKAAFNGEEYMTEQEFNGKIYQRTPVTDMYTLRGCGYKDPQLIECIDACPDAVDQSAHDAKLIRKLMYYTLSFDSAREMAKKTNYYKAKDARHKKKFDDPVYIERTRKFLTRG